MLFSPFLQWTKYPKTVLLFYSGSMAKFYINTLTDIPTHQRFLKVIPPLLFLKLGHSGECGFHDQSTQKRNLKTS